MTKYITLNLAKIPGGSVIACQRLPEVPAVYAFFSQTLSVPTGDADQFFQAVIDLVERRASPTHATSIGSLHRVALDNWSSLGPRKEEALRVHAESEEFRRLLGDMVVRSSGLQSPLYVGQTANLRRRIGQHLDPVSDLSIRLRGSGIAISDCVLAYTEVPPHPLFNQPQTMTLIEEILTRMLRPGFVGRIG
jgi:hypothetical protein